MADRIIIRCSDEEADWLKHAAKLRRQTVSRYVKTAINESLIDQGVDAVLFNIERRSAPKE